MLLAGSMLVEIKAIGLRTLYRVPSLLSSEITALDTYGAWHGMLAMQIILGETLLAVVWRDLRVLCVDNGRRLIGNTLMSTAYITIRY